ncbi:MAG: hypothetical protein KAT34_16175 [Candidatus Aminicenantes bacterium]|nr:hypothetical protein [Candidatus Aminicenantes bacterium]
MWIKQIKVPIEKHEYHYYVCAEVMTYVNFVGLKVAKPKIIKMDILKQSDFKPRTLAKVLETVYVSRLDQFSKYFDPREIANVIKDAKKVRRLKRY